MENRWTYRDKSRPRVYTLADADVIMLGGCGYYKEGRDEMATDDSRWQPDLVEKMTTAEIEVKMKALVPGFDLGEFAAKAGHYLSCEDLSEAEYYPQATFSDVDEDFIWMACEVIWKRLLPDRPAIEHLADTIDNNIDGIAEADEKGKVRKIFKLSAETFELIYWHIVEESPAGYSLKREFYQKLQESTLHDIDAFIESHLILLQLRGEHEKVLKLGEALGQAFEDDAFLDFKAQSLFALNRREEAEGTYRELVARHPDDVWFPLNAGNCFLKGKEEEFEKGKYYYGLALEAAKKAPDSPDGREVLYLVYERAIKLAVMMGEKYRANRLQGMLDSLRGLSSKAAPPAEGKVGRNDPCPCGSGKKYKKCCGQNVSQPKPALPYDRRLMERNLLGINQMVKGQDFGSLDEANRYINEKLKGGPAPEWIPETPLEKAQSLIYQALETAGKTKRLELARQALQISPDCADAYVLLAEEKARSLEEAFKFYEAGVEAGERASGEEVFQNEAGHFWGMVNTRPYMRARVGLAQCLWEMGKREAAVEHFRDMLRLNPNDNQGIRYLLAALLLEMGEIDELERLLGQYDELTAAWLYTAALVAFRRAGDTPDTRRRLREALEYNPHVPAYLSGEKKLPRTIPEQVGFGDNSEAVAYAADFGMGWLNTRGAIEWLRSISRTEKAIKKGRPVTGDVPRAFVQAFEENKAGKAGESGHAAANIYTFKVSLKDSPEVWRKIEIKGDQNLHHLHKAIFKAFERYDEHLYAFFLSNKPWDAKSEYGIPDPESNAKNAKRARIESLDLRLKKKFLYLFDFGDEWWHSIQLLDIRHGEASGRYPRVVESHGEAPPQYDEE
jgi:tetratricopeptide (TPR) repeat protein